MSEIICLKSRERIAQDTERLHFMREQAHQDRLARSAEVQAKIDALAEAIRFYRAYGARRGIP